MIILKIFSSSATFNGVGYNTGKISRNKGELMQASGFELLRGLSSIRPEDYANYLRLISSLNRNVIKPQLHAVLSSKERSYDKNSLTGLARAWLKEMGYGDQPYLVVFHKDTANNHVHMVSTRVDKSGKRIASSFEYLRGMDSLHKLLGVDTKQLAAEAIEEAMTYRFASKGQFRMILEQQGYILRETSAELLELIRFGRKQAELELREIDRRIGHYAPDPARAAQLSTLFEKYRLLKHTGLRHKGSHRSWGTKRTSNGYISEFCEYLKNELRIQLVFQAPGLTAPEGYTVIDHPGKRIFDGEEILPFGELAGAGRNRRAGEWKMSKSQPAAQFRPRGGSSPREKSCPDELHSAQPAETVSPTPIRQNNDRAGRGETQEDSRRLGVRR